MKVEVKADISRMPFESGARLDFGGPTSAFNSDSRQQPFESSPSPDRCAVSVWGVSCWMRTVPSMAGHFARSARYRRLIPPEDGLWLDRAGAPGA